MFVRAFYLCSPYLDEILLTEEYHLSHLELRARWAVTTDILKESHSLPSVLRYAIFSGKSTTTNKTSLNKALPLKNLKYASSRWGTSFSAEVNAAFFSVFVFF